MPWRSRRVVRACPQALRATGPVPAECRWCSRGYRSSAGPAGRAVKGTPPGLVGAPIRRDPGRDDISEMKYRRLNLQIKGMQMVAIKATADHGFATQNAAWRGEFFRSRDDAAPCRGVSGDLRAGRRGRGSLESPGARVANPTTRTVCPHRVCRGEERLRGVPVGVAGPLREIMESRFLVTIGLRAADRCGGAMER